MKQLALVFVFLLKITFVCAQLVDFQCEEKPLVEVLQQLEQEQEIHFSYALSELEGIEVSFDAKALNQRALLDSLLHGFGLHADEKSPDFFLITEYSPLQSYFLQVVDANTLEPLPFASFQSLRKNYGTLVNGQGVLEVKRSILQGDVLISYVGYQKLQGSVDLLSTVSDTLTIPLFRLTEGLKEVVILEYINKGIQVSNDYTTTIIEPNNVEVLPGLPEADILLSAQMLPGISSNDETASGINIRGGSKDQTLIYWDRIPIYHPAHYFGNITSFIPASVKKVEVYKNYIPARYAVASSGLLNIKSFDEVPGSAKGEVNLTSTHLDASVQVPVAKSLSLFVAGRNSYNHLWATPAFSAYSTKLFEGSKIEVLEEESSINDEELDFESKLVFRDLNAKLIWEPGTKDFFSASVLLGSNRLGFSALDDELDNASFQDHEVLSSGFNVYHSRAWNDRWRTELSWSVADYEMVNSSRLVRVEDEDSTKDELFISNGFRSSEFNVNASYTLGENNHVSLGYQLNQAESDLLYEEQSLYEESFTDTLDFQNEVHGFMLSSDWQIGKHLFALAELRYDYFTAIEEGRLKPILHLKYELKPGVGFKASYGHYTQFIRTIDDPELDVTNIAERIWVLTDDEDIPLLSNQQATLGFLLQKGGWLVDLDAYYKRVDGLIASGEYTEEFDDELDFADGAGEVWGLDFMLRKKYRHYSPWLSYSYAKSISLYPEYKESSFPSFFDRPHQLRFVNTFRWKRFEASLGWTYKSGAPYTEPLGVVERVDEEDRYYAITWSDVNSKRLPVYHRLDWSVWYGFGSAQNRWNGQLGFSVLNLYNRANVWSRTYSLEEEDEDNEPEIIEDERYFLGLTPSFSLKVSF